MILVIPVFVPHAGCPHDCCFCNQKVISGSITLPTEAKIAEKIAAYEAKTEKYDEVQIAFFGGSFTAIDPEDQEHYLKAAAPFLKSNGGFADCIRISTRPDAIDGEVLKRLKQYSVRIVELGAQSMDERVLALSDRGHTATDTVNASHLLKEGGFILGLQTMTGLPGADEDSDIATARAVAELKPDFVRIYPTVVVEHTRLQREFENGNYKPATVDEAVRLCSKLCEIYTEQGIAVARIGLQSTDSITREGPGSEVKGGPYHEAFGQLVRSYDGRCAVEAAMDIIGEKYGKNGFRSLTLLTQTRYFSDALGQNRSNALFFREKFGFKNVAVLQEDLSAADVYAKRAGTPEKSEPFDMPGDSFKNRLARVSSCRVLTVKEPAGRDKFRYHRDVVMKLEFKSLR